MPMPRWLAAGAPLWSYSLNSPQGQESQPIVHNGVVYVTTHNTTVALSPLTGKQIWQHDPRNRSWTRPSGPYWGVLARRDDAAGSCPRGGATPPACASAAQSGA